MNINEFSLIKNELRALCTVRNGSTKDQSKVKSEYPITRIESIAEGIINKSKVNYVDFTEAEKRTFYLNPGDILFSHINSFERVGHCVIVGEEDIPIYHGMNLLRIIPDCIKIIPEYLLYFLKSPLAKKFYEDFAQRAINQASINQNTLLQLNIIYPENLTDQQLIIKELKKSLISVQNMLQSALTQKEAVEALQGAILREVFPYKEGDKLPEGWRWEKIKTLSRREIKIFSKNDCEEFIYIDISAIDNFRKKILYPRILASREAPSRAKYLITAGDILISNVRPNLNSVALVTQEYSNSVASSGFTVIRPNPDILSEFLYLFFTSPYFVNYVSDLVQGAIYPAISDNDIYNCSIPLPPVDVQKQVSEEIQIKLEGIYELFKVVENQLEAIDALPAAILREVFEFKS